MYKLLQKNLSQFYKLVAKIDKCHVFQSVKEEFFRVHKMMHNCCKNSRFFGSLAEFLSCYMQSNSQLIWKCTEKGISWLLFTPIIVVHFFGLLHLSHHSSLWQRAPRHRLAIVVLQFNQKINYLYYLSTVTLRQMEPIQFCNSYIDHQSGT